MEVVGFDRIANDLKLDTMDLSENLIDVETMTKEDCQMPGLNEAPSSCVFIWLTLNTKSTIKMTQLKGTVYKRSYIVD